MERNIRSFSAAKRTLIDVRPGLISTRLDPKRP